MTKKKLKEVFIAKEIDMMQEALNRKKEEVMNEILDIAALNAVIIPDELKPYVKTTHFICLQSETLKSLTECLKPVETIYNLPVPYDKAVYVANIDTNETILNLLYDIQLIEEGIKIFEKVFYNFVSTYTDYELFSAFPMLVDDISKASMDNIKSMRFAYDELKATMHEEMTKIGEELKSKNKGVVV